MTTHVRYELTVRLGEDPQSSFCVLNNLKEGASLNDLLLELSKQLSVTFKTDTCRVFAAVSASEPESLVSSLSDLPKKCRLRIVGNFARSISVSPTLDLEVLREEARKRRLNVVFRINSTVPVSSSIEKTFTAYLIETYESQKTGSTLKRYRQFVDFRSELEKLYGVNKVPKLPEKKLLGNMGRSLITKRCQKLENWLNSIAKLDGIFTLPVLYDFLASDVRKRGEKKATGSSFVSNPVSREFEQHVISGITSSPLSSSPDPSRSTSTPSPTLTTLTSTPTAVSVAPSSPSTTQTTSATSQSELEKVIDSEEEHVGKATMDYCGLTEDELSFKKGDIIRFACVDMSGWAFGCTLEPAEGWFPISYVDCIDEKTGQKIEGPATGKGETRSVLEQRKFTRLTLNHHLSKRLTMKLQASLQASTGITKAKARKPSKVKKLEHHLKADSGLPLLFDEAMKYLRSPAGDVKGVFKTPAAPAEVEKIRKLFACDACASLKEVETNAYVVADSIKNFLYYLYEPIFTTSMLPDLLSTSQKLQKKTYDDDTQELDELKLFVSKLPILNYSVIYHLLDLIAYVCHNTHTSVELKDAINMIAPFIVRPPKSHKSQTEPTEGQQQHRRLVEQINHLLWVLAFNRDHLFDKIGDSSC